MFLMKYQQGNRKTAANLIFLFKLAINFRTFFIILFNEMQQKEKMKQKSNMSQQKEKHASRIFSLSYI